MSQRHDYDLVVIGGGSGGVRCARIAAKHGARVVLVEVGRMGGTCVNVGCVPKKLYAIGAQFGAQMEDARHFGWSGGPLTHTWAILRDRVADEVTRLNGVYERILLSAGVEIVRGFGTIADPHTIVVDGRRLSTDRILIATGGEPRMPDLPGVELALTSDQLFSLDHAPRSIVIVGAGYIGVEFACIFAGVGTEVTVVNRGHNILSAFDIDVQTHMRAELERQGIVIRSGCQIQSIDHDPREARVVHLDDGTKIAADAVLMATGRRPRTGGLGLQEVGVALNPDGAIRIDDAYTTSIPTIFAIGDVVGEPELTPVALAQGHWLADRWFGAARPPVDLSLVATAVFGRPNLATVGMTEQQANRSGQDVRIYISTFRSLRAVLAQREERTLVKVIVCAATDRVIGLHVVGDDAGEIVQGFAVAMTAGATKADFDRTIGIHPTLAEELVTLREITRSSGEDPS
jgi:glutathione reductase (NADPH)